MSRKSTGTRQTKRARFAPKGTATASTGRPAWMPWAAALGLVMAIALALWVGGRPGETLAETPVRDAAPAAATQNHAPYPEVVSEDGVIRLAASTFDDGIARHYTYMHGDQPIEFFAVKSRDGTIRAAFNACDVCYGARLGYEQDGDDAVCVNCGRRFPSNDINVVSGGCNPAPLRRTTADGLLIIEVKDIIEGAGYFAG